MLRAADTALVPCSGISGLSEGENLRVCPKNRHFSEFVLEFVLSFS
jgi:hypothetical protein